MANTVIALKKSATPSAAPAALANGELAINYADGILYFKHANGSIASIQSGGGNNFGTINANGSLIVADTNEDVFTIIAGSNITLVTDPVNDALTISASIPGGGDPTPAFIQANTARDHANAAFSKANTANITADLAYGQANTAYVSSFLLMGG